MEIQEHYLQTALTFFLLARLCPNSLPIYYVVHYNCCSPLYVHVFQLNSKCKFKMYVLCRAPKIATVDQNKVVSMACTRLSANN